jgi:hypothetical protein
MAESTGNQRRCRMATIDRIVINDKGVQRTMTPTEWRTLPLTERVRLLRGNPAFYAGQETVSPKEAMAQLR